MGAQPGLELAAVRKGMIQEQSVQTVKRFVNTVLSPTGRADAKRSRPSRSPIRSFHLLIRSNHGAGGERQPVHRPRIPSRRKSTFPGTSSDVVCSRTRACRSTTPSDSPIELVLLKSPATASTRIWLSHRRSPGFSSMAVRKPFPQFPQ